MTKPANTTDTLDHGVLNLPIGHRARGGSIDAQIDRYKAEQAREQRRAASETFHRVREQKARIRQLLAKIGDYRIMEIAKPLGCRRPASARQAIYQAAVLGGLERWITVLEREKFPGGCAQCWAPAGKCDHTDDEWLGPA
jgi:hypothetical protein